MNETKLKVIDEKDEHEKIYEITKQQYLFESVSEDVKKRHAENMDVERLRFFFKY